MIRKPSNWQFAKVIFTLLISTTSDYGRHILNWGFDLKTVGTAAVKLNRVMIFLRRLLDKILQLSCLKWVIIWRWGRTPMRSKYRVLNLNRPFFKTFSKWEKLSISWIFFKNFSIGILDLVWDCLGLGNCTAKITTP